MLVEGCHGCCSVRRATHFVKVKYGGMTLRDRCVLPTSTSQVLSASHTIFFIFFREKVMKKIKKIVWESRRLWRLLVGIRWERFQCRVLALYFQRVTEPVRFWQACGSPLQFRPCLPWWQPLVWRWLVVSRAFGPVHPSSFHPLRRSSRSSRRRR